MRKAGISTAAFARSCAAVGGRAGAWMPASVALEPAEAGAPPAPEDRGCCSLPLCAAALRLPGAWTAARGIALMCAPACTALPAAPLSTECSAGGGAAGATTAGSSVGEKALI